jgi:diaminobutyrate-2-oxoglutarate transaminase
MLNHAGAGGLSMQIFEQYESNVRSYSRAFPVVFTQAKGAFLIDEQDRTYIDFLSGAGSLNYGHNNPRLKAAVLRYLEQDGITLSLDLATVAKRQFIERFRSTILAPRGLDYKLQFTGPTGANGVEAALKLARKVTGRANVVAFTGAFHGLSAGALAVTANAYYRNERFVNRSNVSFLPFEGYVDGVDSSRYLRKAIQDTASGVDLPAAIILETVQAEGGINVASSQWLQNVQAICREYGILMIVDDIQVGNGRTGTYFSFERAGIVPDIVVLSKSIGGFGLPMTVVLVRPELDDWQPGEHTGTFRGNNLAFIAGAKALSYWEDDQLSEHINRMGRRVAAVLEQLRLQHPETLPDSRGLGLIWGLEVADPEMAQAIRRVAFERGLIVELCGARDHVVKLLPPLTIEESVLADGLAILASTVALLQRNALVASPATPAVDNSWLVR